MASIIKQITKLFSFRGALRSNILSTSYTSIGMGSGSSVTGAGFRSQQNSTFNSFTSSRLLTSWYMKMNELKDYELSELSNIAVIVLTDFLSNYFNNDHDLITLPIDCYGKEEFEKKINHIFSDLKLVESIKDHLGEIIYYGSYSYKIDWDKLNKKWKKYELFDPYNVVTVKDQNGVKCHLVTSQQGKILQAAPRAILRLGIAGLRLINDLDPQLTDTKTKTVDFIGEEDTVLSSASIAGGYPLYYNIIGKVKEYLIRDQLLSLLSIKDLIQPLLLLIRVDKSTDPTAANQLAINTENLINKYSDLSAIFGANFSIMDLMDSILNNIRVLPDYNSAMGDMNSIDLTKITNKIQEIKGDQDGNRESIYNTLGIPRALSSGDATKWQSIKDSQRLNSKISGYIDDLCSSVAIATADFYYLLTGKEIDPKSIGVNLFKATDVDYSNALNSADIVNQLIDSLNRILEAAQRFCSESKLINYDAYMHFIKDQLSTVDGRISDIITEAIIKKFIKDLSSESEEQGGGFGRGRSYFSKTK